MSVAFLQPQWAAPSGVHAAFSLRSGGASAVPWNSLNLGLHVGDDPLAVRDNRARLRHALRLPTEPVWLEQVHGTDVCVVDGESPSTPRADAIVTRAANIVLAIMVADCLPVLLTTEDGSVIAAAHAGWRGLAAGVLENTVAAMETPSARLHAWLGPCIGLEYFEVGAEVRAAFIAAGDDAKNFRANPQGKFQCDLVAIARARLERIGIASVTGGQWCTAADPVRFYSHRRDQRTGRMAALLWREG
jgi:polyphenol oxidase